MQQLPAQYAFCLEMAIAGETEEFMYMYPRMATAALNEGNADFASEIEQQIEESKEHAEQFKEVLAKAQKRFAALTKVEKRHAAAYQQVMETLSWPK
jgi:rubrerythrin